MSNRLESLKSGKPPAKPGLKFKPKTVARKSKEDRDKNAPDIKAEEKPRLQNSALRGRGGARGGRGGARGRGASYVGTHVVSAGPLAMGSVGMGNGTTTSKTGLTNDRIYNSGESRGSVLAGMKLKPKEYSAAGSVDADSSDEDSSTRINMNKEYAFEEEDTLLFPVQPTKNLETLVEPELVLQEWSKPNSRAQTVDSVKTEQSDSVTPEVPMSAAPTVVDEKLVTEEQNKIIDDQKSIVDLVAAQLGHLSTSADPQPSSDYLLFQMPKLHSEDSQPASESVFASADTEAFQGQVGNINFHKSGRISLTLSDGSVLECAKGTTPSFLQELYVIDVNKQTDEDAAMLDAEGQKIGGDIYRLGEVSGKIVATPYIA